jgi:hypothetical protein
MAMCEAMSLFLFSWRWLFKAGAFACCVVVKAGSRASCILWLKIYGFFVDLLNLSNLPSSYLVNNHTHFTDNLRFCRVPDQPAGNWTYFTNCTIKIPPTVIIQLILSTQVKRTYLYVSHGKSSKTLESLTTLWSSLQTNEAQRMKL